MIAIDFDYARPLQLDEALRLLGRPGAIPLAGGQSLVPALSMAHALAADTQPTMLIDISRLTELRHISIVNHHLVIGAAVSMATIAANPVTRSVPLLGEVLPNVASAAIRTLGTLVGNLVSASPNSELPVVMVALQAVLALRSAAGTRDVRAADFFVGPHRTILDAGEIVTEIRIALPAGEASAAFQEVAARAGAPPLCCVAACLTIGRDGRCSDVRIAAGGIIGRPVRCTDAEASLNGHPCDCPLPLGFADNVALPPSPDLPEARYAATVLPVLIRRAVSDAIARGGPGKMFAAAPSPAVPGR